MEMGMIRLTASQAKKAGLTPKKKPHKAKGKPYPLFEAMCEANDLRKPYREFRFDRYRRWRFDWAWPTHIPGGAGGVALECDGGVWQRGRHNRGKGFIADQEKMNEAQLAGWIVLRCVPTDIES